MPTNRTRKLRVSKNRTHKNLTAEYLGGLCCDAFLEDGGNRRAYPSKLTSEEHELVREYEHCHLDFEKWLKYRERKLRIQNARKLKSEKVSLLSQNSVEAKPIDTQKV